MAKRNRRGGVQDTDPNNKEMRAVFDQLSKGQGTVEFGFIQGISSDAAIERSFWNEYGTVQNPPRPHLTPVADDSALIRREVFQAVYRGTMASKARRAGAKRAGKVVSGGKAIVEIQRDFDLALKEMAQALANRVRQEIIEKSTPANAPSTVAKKGFNDPLIETGEMRDNVAWVVRDKRGAIVAQGLAI